MEINLLFLVLFNFYLGVGVYVLLAGFRGIKYKSFEAKIPSDVGRIRIATTRYYLISSVLAITIGSIFIFAGINGLAGLYRSTTGNKMSYPTKLYN